jgi:hypothetical protein
VSKILRMGISHLRKRGANQGFPVFQFPATASCSRPHPAIRRFPASTRGLGVEGCDIEPTDNRKRALRSTCLSARHCHLSLSDRHQPLPTEAPTYRGIFKRSTQPFSSEAVPDALVEPLRLFVLFLHPRSTLNTLPESVYRGTRRITQS